MRTTEPRVNEKSDFYINNPSASIMDTFLYPLHMGHFLYEPGYSKHRKSFDSFLLLYVLHGSITLQYHGSEKPVPMDHFMLINCYEEHTYFSTEGAECIWMHFDGIQALRIYELITGKLGTVFSVPDSLDILSCISSIYESFRKNNPMPEYEMARRLYNALTCLLLEKPSGNRQADSRTDITPVLSYIQKHLSEELSIPDLAGQAALSPYHFIRVFRAETGMTPHAYIISCRMRTAKILLSENSRSVSEISDACGFSDLSAFSAAFRKYTGLSPSAYRNQFEKPESPLTKTEENSL